MLVGAGQVIKDAVTVIVGPDSDTVVVDISVMVDGGIVIVVREPNILVVIVEAGRVIVDVKSIVTSEVTVKPGSVTVEPG
jgi:hypothetical protein